MNNSSGTMYDKDNRLPHFLVTDILMYVVCTSVLVVNGGIALIYLVQRLRRTSSCPISPAGLLVLNLLISDALVGAIGIYTTATYVRGLTDTKYGCVNRIAMRYFGRMGSHMALINVALDRYVAIMHTLHYRDWIIMRRTLGLIAVGWLVPLGGIAYIYLSNDWHPGLKTCSKIRTFYVFLTCIRLPSHLVALLCVIVIQCRIYLQLKNYEKENAHQMLRRYSHKSARVLFWVTSTYVVCWIPFDVSLVVILIWPGDWSKMIFDPTLLLANASFLVNAFVFSYKTENIRKPVSELCWDVRKFVTGRGNVSDTNRASGVSAISGGGGIWQGSLDGTSVSNTTLSSSISSQLKVPTSAQLSHI